MSYCSFESGCLTVQLLAMPEEAFKVDITLCIEGHTLGLEQLALKPRVIGVADPPGGVDHPPPRHHLCAVRVEARQRPADAARAARHRRQRRDPAVGRDPAARDAADNLVDVVVVAHMRKPY